MDLGDIFPTWKALIIQTGRDLLLFEVIDLDQLGAVETPTDTSAVLRLAGIGIHPLRTVLEIGQHFNA